jgi:hypothetical protein
MCTKMRPEQSKKTYTRRTIRALTQTLKPRSTIPTPHKPFGLTFLLAVLFAQKLSRTSATRARAKSRERRSTAVGLSSRKVAKSVVA